LRDSATSSETIRPFQLVKIFSYSSFIVILVSTLALAWVISQRAKELLLERSEAYAQLFAENLNHQVFQQFVIPTVLRYRKIALSNPRQFERLDTIVRNITHGLKIESITLFDAQENVVSYSTLSDLVGKRDTGGIHYQKALQGEHSSLLVVNGGVLSLLVGQESVSGQLKTYIPFRQEEALSQNTGSIMGVIEIVQNLSDDLEAITRFQVTAMITSVLIMAGLFAILQVIVARADRIIAERALEKRRLEEELQQAERLASLGKMVAAVSHEIKNPLGIIRSTAEMLGKRLNKAAPGNDHLANIIVEETKRLDTIVREFLDFARPQFPRLLACDLKSVLEKVLQFMEPEFSKHNIEVERGFDGLLPVIQADEHLLYRAFLNLMVNSVQAMPNGGRMTVTTKGEEKTGRAIVEIADTGSGIAPDKREMIFTPFYSDKIRGTGLGLAIVKNIVDAHGGAISVQSREGEGTTMRMELPG